MTNSLQGVVPCLFSRQYDAPHVLEYRYCNVSFVGSHWVRRPTCRPALSFIFYVWLQQPHLTKGAQYIKKLGLGLDNMYLLLSSNN